MLYEFIIFCVTIVALVAIASNKDDLAHKTIEIFPQWLKVMSKVFHRNPEDSSTQNLQDTDDNPSLPSEDNNSNEDSE